MALQANPNQTLLESQEQFEAVLHQQLRQAVRIALISVLEAEVDAFIGALLYQRSEQRRDQRNGHYTRDLETSMGLITDAAVTTRSCLNAISVAVTKWTKP